MSRKEAEQALTGIDRSERRCEVHIVLRLPPPGEPPNDRRYSILMAGRGYEGLLVSDRTRVPGLISIYDVKPTVKALEGWQGASDHIAP